MKLNRVFQLTALFLIPAMLSDSLVCAAKKPLDTPAIKQKITAQGVGHGVRITLADKTEAKGIIVSIGDQSFTLKAKGADQPRSIEYAQITGVHGGGLSTGAKIGIAAGIVVIVVVVAIASLGKGMPGLTGRVD